MGKVGWLGSQHFVSNVSGNSFHLFVLYLAFSGDFGRTSIIPARLEPAATRRRLSRHEHGRGWMWCLLALYAAVFVLVDSIGSVSAGVR